MARQVAGRGAELPVDGADVARHVVQRWLRGDLERHVDLRGDQVHHAVGKEHPQRDAGMPPGEFQQQRREEGVAQPSRHAHPHMAAQGGAQAVDLRLGRRHFLQDAQAVLVERAPRLGQLQPARGPAQQLRAGLVLQLAQLAADLRARDAAPPARLGQVAGLDDVDEGLDQVEVHPGFHGELSRLTQHCEFPRGNCRCREPGLQ